MSNEITYYIREHVWKQGQTREYCLHCNSYTTIGDHYISDCELRFNEKGFKQFLEFRNISIIDTKTAIRRFTNQEFKIKDLMKQFKDLMIKNKSTLLLINRKSEPIYPKM